MILNRNITKSLNVETNLSLSDGQTFSVLLIFKYKVFVIFRNFGNSNDGIQFQRIYRYHLFDFASSKHVIENDVRMIELLFPHIFNIFLRQTAAFQKRMTHR